MRKMCLLVVLGVVFLIAAICFLERMNEYSKEKEKKLKIVVSEIISKMYVEKITEANKQEDIYLEATKGVLISDYIVVVDNLLLVKAGKNTYTGKANIIIKNEQHRQYDEALSLIFGTTQNSFPPFETYFNVQDTQDKVIVEIL